MKTLKELTRQGPRVVHGQHCLLVRRPLTTAGDVYSSSSSTTSRSRWRSQHKVRTSSPAQTRELERFILHVRVEDILSHSLSLNVYHGDHIVSNAVKVNPCGIAAPPTHGQDPADVGGMTSSSPGLWKPEFGDTTSLGWSCILRLLVLLFSREAYHQCLRSFFQTDMLCHRHKVAITPIARAGRRRGPSGRPAAAW